MAKEDQLTELRAEAEPPGLTEEEVAELEQIRDTLNNRGIDHPDD
jgi:hypothetical protein